MKYDDILSFPKLVIGTLATATGSALSAATESVPISTAEPVWLNSALKYSTLIAAFVTVLAGILKMFLDLRKDQREEAHAEREAEREIELQRTLSETDKVHRSE